MTGFDPLRNEKGDLEPWQYVKRDCVWSDRDGHRYHRLMWALPECGVEMQICRQFRGSGAPTSFRRLDVSTVPVDLHWFFNALSCFLLNFHILDAAQMS